jgi:hypothetical protein
LRENKGAAQGDEFRLNGPLNNRSWPTAHLHVVDETTPEQEPAMSNLKKIIHVALVAGVAGLALPAASNTASALPMAGLDSAVLRDGQAAAQIEQARWVCGPYRCFWQPNYWGPSYWGHGPRWGWRGGWRRW